MNLYQLIDPENGQRSPLIKVDGHLMLSEVVLTLGVPDDYYILHVGREENEELVLCFTALITVAKLKEMLP